MLWRSQFVVPLSALLLGVLGSRIVRRIALAVGFVDKPDRWRKLQDGPIPLGGGLAVWLATWSACVIGRFTCVSGPASGGDSGWFTVGLAIASFLTLVVGLVDDHTGLSAH